MARMTRRSVLAMTLAMAASPALAEPGLPRVTLTTSLGDIELELEAVRAPITTANFLAYVNQKRFDGSSFYRAMKLAAAPPSGLIQGGLQGDPARVLPPIAHEPTTLTGLTHQNGTISMARFAPGTATADFFICIGDQPFLDANPAASGDNQGFAAFGHVTAGMDTVIAILDAQVSATRGEGVMKGEMLDPPVTIVRARRTAGVSP